MLRACVVAAGASFALCAWDSSGAESVRVQPIAPVAPLVPVAHGGAPAASGASAGDAAPLRQFTSCAWSNGGTTYDLSSMTLSTLVNQGAPRRADVRATASTPRVTWATFFPSAAAAGYEVNDVRDGSVWYYFNVCGATQTPVTDGTMKNREKYRAGRFCCCCT